jgi:crotonobetainyl-CoA:carnitine CoA-transferase CaiB-like acyl-CoA transferase
MHLTGEPDGPPTRIGAPSMVDHTTGLTRWLACCRRSSRRAPPARAATSDTCLFDAALHQLGYTAIWYLNEGYVPERQTRSAHFSLAPVQTLPTADGWVFVMCLTDKFWNALLDVLGRKDLNADPRFRHAGGAQPNREPLTAASTRVSASSRPRTG